MNKRFDKCCQLLVIPSDANRNRITISDEEPVINSQTMINDIWIEKDGNNSLFYVYNGTVYEYIGTFGSNSVFISDNPPPITEDMTNGILWIDTSTEYPILNYYANDQWNYLGQLTNNHFEVGYFPPSSPKDGDIWYRLDDDGPTSIITWIDGAEINLGQLTNNQFEVGPTPPSNLSDGDIWYRLNDDGTTSIITWMDGIEVDLGTISNAVIGNAGNVEIGDKLPDPSNYNDGMFFLLPRQMGELNIKEDGEWKYYGLVQDEFQVIIRNMDEFYNAGFEITKDTSIGSEFYIDDTRGLVIRTHDTFKATVSCPFPDNGATVNMLNELRYFGTPYFTLMTYHMDSILGVEFPRQVYFTVPNNFPGNTNSGNFSDTGLFTRIPHWTNPLADDYSYWFNYSGATTPQRSQTLTTFNPNRTYELITTTLPPSYELSPNSYSFLDILKFTTLYWTSGGSPPPPPTSIADFKQPGNTIYLRSSQIEGLYFFAGDSQATWNSTTGSFQGSMLESELKYLKYNLQGVDYEYIFGDPDVPLVDP